MIDRKLPWVLYALAIPAALTVLGRLEEYFHVGDLLSEVATNWRRFFRTLWSDVLLPFEIRLSPIASDMLTFAALIAGTQVANAVARLSAGARAREPEKVIQVSSVEEIRAAQRELDEERQAELIRSEERFRQTQINIIAALLTFAAFFFEALSNAFDAIGPTSWPSYFPPFMDTLSFGFVGATLLIAMMLAIFLLLVVGPALLHLSVWQTQALRMDDGGVKVVVSTRLSKPPTVMPVITIPAGVVGAACIALAAYLLVRLGSPTGELDPSTLITAGLMSAAIAASVLFHSNSLTRILLMVVALSAASLLADWLSPFFSYLTSVVERATAP